MLLFSDQSSLWLSSLSGALTDDGEHTVMRYGSLFVMISLRYVIHHYSYCSREV